MSFLFLINRVVLLQDIPSPDHAIHDEEEEVWETVGASSGRSTRPPPTVGDVVPEEA
jgi:hypothetical protein